MKELSSGCTAGTPPVPASYTGSRGDLWFGWNALEVSLGASFVACACVHSTSLS